MSRTTEHGDDDGYGHPRGGDREERRARLLTGSLAVAALLAALVSLWQTQSSPLEQPDHQDTPGTTAATTEATVPAPLPAPTPPAPARRRRPRRRPRPRRARRRRTPPRSL
ncbi:hypothetical protein J1792_19750 [Streptomyces triculaminicus]|uniref:Uncharacterized protein n=1 Tax=Streptomyces triculaminicus TaxID=2816232 RepID=A0A939FMG6_9ACTN|nr:hypothetical protein [Streptomyces triculaminicus]MBO0654931.1 hypothetical protein [Streptomyces triculaminicus]